ncbi:MAG: hypothetical protein IJT83_16460 [Victivallales bacterium]|nr:hypothetical protein [Victivallales bacterium]
MNYCHEIPAVIPWWTLNGRLTEENAIAQLDEFLERGIREFFIYPNFGLESPDYLTEEWFSFVGVLLRECAKRGMALWIYDELNWPSGSAGGRLCRDFPQYKMRSLRSQRLVLQPGERWCPDRSKEYVWAGGFMPGEPCPCEISTRQEFVNTGVAPLQLLAIDKHLVDDQFLCSMGTNGTWNEPGILDALNPEAVRTWMSLAYYPFAEHFPEAMGKTIRGFFFDEPTMISPFHTSDVPWTPGLEELFKEQYGYECRPCLWALFTQAAGMEQFRYDFWHLVARRFASAFTGQLSAWCQAHGVILSGHCWPEEPSCQRLMTTATGDTFYLQRHLQLPGTDFLYCENNYVDAAGMCPRTPGWARNLIYAAKLPSSSARYTNAQHTICETSGVCALGDKWSSFAAQKRPYDFLYAMGISVMNPARPYDMTDVRKHLCALDVAQPYWRHYRLLTAYMERLHQFNGKGRTDTTIAVLSPLSTRFAFSDIAADTSIRQEKTPLPPVGDCAEAMLSTLDTLVRTHLDFELLFEDVVLDSAISPDGELLAPNSRFKVVILPQCYALDDAVWAKLDEFARAGGHIVAIGDPPTLPLMHDPKPLAVKTLPLIQLHHGEKGFSGRLEELLRKLAAPDYAISGLHNDEILAHVRRDGDWQGIFLVNATPGAKHFSLVGCLAERLCTLGDLQSGREYRWHKGQEITLRETQSCLLTTDSSSGEAPLCETTEPTTLQELPHNGWRIQGSVRNCMRMKLEVMYDGEFVSIADNGATPFDLDPDIMEKMAIRASFDIAGSVPKDLRIWLDNDSFSELCVNGTPVNVRRYEKLIDPRNVAVPIAPYCRKGGNVVTLTMKLSKWMKRCYGMRIHFTPLLKGLTPPLLMGEFIVGQDDYQIAPLPKDLSCGALEAQGFPQFCDELSVCQFFDVGIPVAKAVLTMSESPLPIETTLNGTLLGVRIWQNGSLPIPEGLLKERDNSLVLKLCGDVWNALERRWLGMPVMHVPFLLPTVRIVKGYSEF